MEKKNDALEDSQNVYLQEMGRELQERKGSWRKQHSEQSIYIPEITDVYYNLAYLER